MSWKTYALILTPWSEVQGLLVAHPVNTLSSSVWWAQGYRVMTVEEDCMRLAIVSIAMEEESELVGLSTPHSVREIPLFNQILASPSAVLQKTCASLCTALLNQWRTLHWWGVPMNANSHFIFRWGKMSQYSPQRTVMLQMPYEAPYEAWNPPWKHCMKHCLKHRIEQCCLAASACYRVLKWF